MIHLNRIKMPPTSTAASSSTQADKRASNAPSSQVEVTRPLSHSQDQEETNRFQSRNAIGTEDTNRLNRFVSLQHTEGPNALQVDVERAASLFFPSRDVEALRGIRREATGGTVLANSNNRHASSHIDTPLDYSSEELSDYSFDTSCDESSDEDEYIQKRRPVASMAQQKRIAEPETSSSKRLRTGYIPSSTSMDWLPQVASSNLTPDQLNKICGEIYKKFPGELDRLIDWESGRHSRQQAHDIWLVSIENRFMAALLNCTGQAYKQAGVKITAAAMDVLLPQALQQVHKLKEEGNRSIAKVLADDDQFYLRALLKAPEKFVPRAEETAEIFAEVAKGIERLTGCKIAADQMWRLCIDPQAIMLVEKLDIDVNTPLLGYLFDSQPGYLNQMAHAWLCGIKRVESGQALDVDFLIELHRVFAGRDRDDDDDDFMDLDGMDDAGIPSDIEMHGVEYGVLRQSKEAAKERDELAKELMDRFQILLKSNKDGKNKEWSDLFGQPFQTFEREPADPIALKNAQQYLLEEYEKDRKTPGMDPLLAELKFVQRLSHLHVYDDGNTRLCHLLANLLVIWRGQSPFMFGDPNILDIYSAQELRKAKDAKAIHFTRDGHILPMSSIEEVVEIAHEAMEVDAPITSRVRLPLRNAGITSPWPLSKRLKDRLYLRNKTEIGRQISDVAAKAWHQGGLNFFARRIVNTRAEVEKLETKLPGELRRYTTSLAGHNGRSSVFVSLLAYVENGYLTDIRTDTPKNREQIGIPLHNPVQEAFSRGEIYLIDRAISSNLLAKPQDAMQWLADIRAAIELKTGKKGMSILKFVRAVVNPKVIGRNDRTLPDGVLLYDYKCRNKENGKLETLTLVARVVDREVTMVRLDDAEGKGREEVTANKKRDRVRNAIAAGKIHSITTSLESKLCGLSRTDAWLKKIQDAVSQAIYKGSMLEFVREIVRPEEGWNDGTLPDGVLLYDYEYLNKDKKLETLTLVARVVDGMITRVRLDDPKGKGRKEVIDNKNPSQIRGAIDDGTIYKMHDFIYAILSPSRSHPEVNILRDTVEKAEYPGKLIEFVREVVKPGRGRKDSKNPLPDGVLLYDYEYHNKKNGKRETLTLVARVIDKEVTMVALNTPEGRKMAINNKELNRIRDEINAGKVYEVNRDKGLADRLNCKKPSIWVKNIRDVAALVDYEEGTTLAAYEDVAMLAAYKKASTLNFIRREVVKPGGGREDDKNPLPEGVLLYDYKYRNKENGKIETLKMLAHVVANQIGMVRLDTLQGRKDIEIWIAANAKFAAQSLVKQAKKPKNPAYLEIKDRVSKSGVPSK